MTSIGNGFKFNLQFHKVAIHIKNQCNEKINCMHALDTDNRKFVLELCIICVRRQFGKWLYAENC